MTERNRQLINVMHINNRRDKVYAVATVEKIDGVKKLKIDRKPDMHYYVTKEEFREEHSTHKPLFVEKHKVERRTALHKDLYNSIYEHIMATDWEEERGDKYEDLYQKCMSSGKTYALRALHGHPFIHNSDLDLADHHIGRYLDDHKDSLVLGAGLDKAYSDIEVDAIDIVGFPDPEVAAAPINAISLYCDKSGTLYQFLLREERNPMIEEFEKDIDGFIERCHRNYEKMTAEASKDGKPKKFADFVDIRMYNDELDMIKDYFDVINEEERPDVVCFWNMSFDIQTFINRIKYLNNGDFESIMCPKDFQSIKKAYWYEDKKCNDISDSKNSFQIAGWSSYQDQMIVYAVIRKTMGKKESYALEAIAQEELGYGKQDMKGYSFKEFAYKDYPQFVEYSMNDSVVLRDIEEKVADMEQLYAISQMTRTRMEKAMTKTICLKNMAAQFFFERDLILSNNPNTSRIDHTDDDKSEKFKGAFVADPSLLADSGMFVGGQRSDRVFERVCDLDLSSLYPSIILAYNIDFATMFGRIDIWEHDEAGEDVNRSEEFMHNWVSDDSVAIGAKWLNLPSAEDLVREFGDVA